LDKSLEIDREIVDASAIPYFESRSDVNSEIIFESIFKNLERLCNHKQNVIFDGNETISLDNLKFEAPKEQWQFTAPLDLNKFSFKGSKNSSEILQTDSLEKDVIDLLEEFRSHKDLPSIFVIDDAQDLFYKIPDNKPYEWKMRDISLDNCSEPIFDTRQSPYNVFQRVFRIFSNVWERLMLITVGKCEKIIGNMPKTKEDRSSHFKYPVTFMKDFFLIQTFNVNSGIAKEIEADMFQKRNYTLENNNPIKDWNEFLGSKFRIIEYFKFGRPLSYGIFKEYEEENVKSGRYNFKENFEDCSEFQILDKKLTGVTDGSEIQNLKCLYSMFNFAFGTNFIPDFIKKTDLVDEYMMTIVNCTFESRPGNQVRCGNQENELCQVSGCFMPEGVINFLSARYFANNPKSLLKIMEYSLRYGIFNEECYAIIFSQYALIGSLFFHQIDYDLKLVRKLAFKPISIGSFLEKLGGQSIESFIEYIPALKNSRLSFGYFENFPVDHIKRPFDLMAKCLFKGSAISLGNSFPGLNLMIPLVLEDGRISFLGVKTIYIKEGCINDVIQTAISKMSFSDIFGYQSDRPFILIIIALCRANKHIYTEKFPLKVQNPLNNPPVLIFRGISIGIISWKYSLKSPKDEIFQGIQEEYLGGFDHMIDLVQEFSLYSKDNFVTIRASDSLEN
jgi:hypothetical protein